MPENVGLRNLDRVSSGEYQKVLSGALEIGEMACTGAVAVESWSCDQWRLGWVTRSGWGTFTERGPVCESQADEMSFVMPHIEKLEQAWTGHVSCDA